MEQQYLSDLTKRMEQKCLANLAEISPSLARVARIYLAICRAFKGIYHVIRKAFTMISHYFSIATQPLYDVGQRIKQYCDKSPSQVKNKVYTYSEASTSYLLAYLEWTLYIHLAYYRAISGLHVPSWAAVKRFWFSSWNSLLNLVYRVCNSAKGSATNIFGIMLTNRLWEVCISIKRRLTANKYTVRNKMIVSGYSWPVVSLPAKQTMLSTLLPLLVLVISVVLYRSDADYFNIISTVYVIVVKVQIYILLLIFDVIYDFAVGCIVVSGFFHELADASTAFFTTLQAVVYEDSESFWFMLSSATMSVICSILPAAVVCFSYYAVDDLEAASTTDTVKTSTAPMREGTRQSIDRIVAHAKAELLTESFETSKTDSG